ncbi:hypothetical protein ABI_12020 [Asticcacaulis biprosthecium C19]|uniref:DUF433 domain-containing protein n=1 Tax=Asticcacaulis biprosthecium C19 TaxID=715226 RepID=F4QHM8_9CAUL|nr:DUF433 domain-containing protein [Asticcacaulis biprosthecium]EGF92765.1 hypothetical protein ABI_12020 [Asticcacaulis biprosthecium C19]
MTDRTYSVNEAAFVTERSPKALTREFDEGVLTADAKAQGLKGGKSRQFGRPELRFFRLMKHWEKDFTPDGRRTVFDSVRKMGPRQKVLELRNARYDMAPIDAELKARETSLEDLRGKFVSRDGDVFFKGKTISAYRVAALSKSQSVGEIAQDYPSLSPKMIQDAIDFEMIYPKKGKPYPSRSLKRTLAEAGETIDPALLDLMFGDEPDPSRDD